MSASTTARLMDVRSWLAQDIDDEGRVLAGHDDSGSLQLVEIARDGTRTPLTALPSRCLGRYVPGRRQVVVSHDQGGDENTQLSVLDLDGLDRPATLDDLRPLVRDLAHLHQLLDVSAETLVYATNRRNGTDMDVIARDLVLGTERVVAENVGYAVETTVSPARDRCAVTALSLRPASTVVSVVDPDGKMADVTERDALAKNLHVSWTADGTALVMSSNQGRDMSAVVRVPLDGGDWQTLVADDTHNLSVVPSPDATRLLVARNIDGAHRVSIHAADGGLQLEVDLPEPSIVLSSYTRWSPDGRRVVLPTSGPTDPGSVRVVDAETGAVRTVADATEGIPAALRERLVTPTSHRVPAPDGELIPCFVHRPTAADADQPTRGSAVIELHGGPEAQAMQRWDPLIQSMVLAGLTMQPDLWAAGVDEVGMSSLVTFLENTSPYRRAYREKEYGRLEEDRDFLVEASPLTYLDQLRAPLFIIHGANDPRVPLSEAEQVRDALQAKGIECVMKVYDDEGHGLAKRANRIDAFPAATEFLVAQLSQDA
jgi:dipeptidyl aminopeptidase/acylaminoacyl peptidase